MGSVSIFNQDNINILADSILHDPDLFPSVAEENWEKLLNKLREKYASGIEGYYINFKDRFYTFAFLYHFFLKLDNFDILRCVSKIPASTFYGGIELQKIDIPDSITSIGSNAFTGCENLKEITIPESIVEIDRALFSSCRALSKIIINASIKKVPDSFAARAFSLNYVRLPEGLESIDDYAFESCISLQSIDLPRTLKNIGEAVFIRCINLREINYAGTSSEWKEVKKGFGWCPPLQDIAIHCIDRDMDEYDRIKSKLN